MSEQDDISPEPLPDLSPEDLPEPAAPTEPEDLGPAGEEAPPDIEDLEEDAVTLGGEDQDAPFSGVATVKGPLPELEEDEGERTIAELRARVGRLEDLVNYIQLPSRLPNIFVADTQTNGTWQEAIPIAGVLTAQSAATGWRDCTSSSDTSALLVLNPSTSTFAPVLEIQDGNAYRYLNIGGGRGQAFEVFLTQNGGANGSDGTSTAAAFPTYTYNVFTDAAKTVQIGTAVSVQWHRFLQCAVTAGTKGLAQWSGSTLHLLFADEYWDRDSCAAQTTGMP